VVDRKVFLNAEVFNVWFCLHRKTLAFSGNEAFLENIVLIIRKILTFIDSVTEHKISNEIFTEFINVYI
jgi:hypothetical protein